MTSRLAQAHSAYLRSAAHQPVHWFPWGPEPFERAKTDGKPILLDVGAVWCHWCHVMDGESYENPRLAEQLNRDWICVKVDRDERPDVDARYQRAVQALTGQGGWPLTAFLTPDGDVFFGGTYFPPDDRHGRQAFPTVLAELARIYREQPDRIAAQASEIRTYMSKALTESSTGPIPADVLSRGADAIAQGFDFRHGGFGSQPKFPHPAACDFLLARWFDTGDKWAWEIVERTLTAMARGGVYDQVGGGFHRYSVDARWIVLHFEKMSYDNSELLRAYVHAAGTGEAAAPTASSAPSAPSASLYRHTAAGIADWVTTVMSDPAGGYYASQDADVGLEDDGDYFTWTVEETRAVLTDDEFAVLSRHYDIEAAGEMHERPGRNVLFVHESVAEIAKALGRPEQAIADLLGAGRARLLRARAARPTPFVDTTLYTGWNGMMASAMLEVAALLDRPDAERHALATLERVFRDAAVHDGAGGVRHAIGGSELDGILEDQVHIAAACLDAFEATGHDQWRERSVRLMEHAWHGYRDEGALTDTARSRGGEGFLKHPMTPVHDAPTPSANAVAAIVLARLAEHTGKAMWRERQEQLLEACAPDAGAMGVHGATLLRALDWYRNPAAHVVVVGNPADPATAALRRAARAGYRPRKVVTLLSDSADFSLLASPVKSMITGKAPRAYVCAGPQCGPPADDPAALAETLATFRGTG